MVTPQNPHPAPKRKSRLLLIVLLVIVLVLAIPLVVYGLFLAAILLTPGQVKWN